MLRALRVRDLALVDDLDLEFGPGLNAITGETGAGKSLLTRALALACGARGDGDWVRSGAAALEVEAVLEVDDDPERRAGVRRLLATAGLEEAADATTLVLRRRVARSGRGQASIGGRPVPVAVLAELGRMLVRSQGQHESLLLLDETSHLRMLDEVAGTGAQAAAMRESFARVADLVGRLDALETGAAERARRLDLARHDAAELDKARLTRADEEAELALERERLRHAARLGEAAQEATERLDAGEHAARASVERTVRRLGELARIDPALDEIVARLEEAAGPLADACRALQDYQTALDADPGRLDAIEERLVLLDRLRRKHGAADLAGLLEKREALARELETAERDDADPRALRDALAAASAIAWSCADALSVARHAGAAELERRVGEELARLGMAGSRLEVRFRPLAAAVTRGAAAMLARDGAGLSPDGHEMIDFLLGANPGEEARAIGKVASGGELSRVMLALRSVAGGVDAPTVVLDEVDAGIGGTTAEAIGRRLAEVARRHQVLCITHLAQIAAFADRQIAVDKSVSGARTRARAVVVEGVARVREVARMLGGGADDTQAGDLAVALLERARGVAQAATAGAGFGGVGAGGRTAKAGKPDPASTSAVPAARRGGARGGRARS